MKDIAPDWFETCVAQLTSTGTQRVWSVLVTIFGDLAQDKSDQISGALTTSMTSLTGIKPEATRVALHRLRKEGWIESTRIGRNSVHQLTKFGRRQSAEAAPRIYARETEQPSLWHVLIAGNTDSSRNELAELMLTGDYISLNPTTSLAPGPVPDGLEDVLGMESNAISAPEWLRELCGPDSVKHAYDAFLETIDRVEELLPSDGVGDPMRIAVLRVMIVHNWRRIILRHPPLPAAFLPLDWQEAACRTKVADVLDRLPKPNLQVLEDLQGS